MILVLQKRNIADGGIFLNLIDMKRRITVEVIAGLLIFLFLYASVSKLIDYQKFRVQIGQSPLLTAYARWFAVIVPVLEIIISLMLAIPRLQLIGFYASFNLMVMFTSYIIAITNFSEYIPCSCGGILQNMTWNQHLLFNIFFVLISLSGILLHSKSDFKTYNVLEYQ